MKIENLDSNLFRMQRRNPRVMFGTENMALKIEELLLPKFPFIKDYNWVIMPGEMVTEDRFTVAWCHLNHTNASIVTFWKEEYENFDEVIFVSDWQAQKFFDSGFLNKQNFTVLKNAIDPIEAHVKPPTDVVNIVYTPDDARGLPILLKALDSIKDSDIRVHIFRDVNPLKIPKDPRIVLRGWVPPLELRKALKEMHIFAYPAVFEETSCISLMEAMSAGCYCVHSDLGALPETSLGLTQMYTFIEDEAEHAKVFSDELNLAIQAVKDGWDSSNQIVETNKSYSWSRRLPEWEEFIQKLKSKAEKRQSK